MMEPLKLMFRCHSVSASVGMKVPIVQSTEFTISNADFFSETSGSIQLCFPGDSTQFVPGRLYRVTIEDAHDA